MLEWFKTIKLYDGKKRNTIAYGETIFGVKDTVDMIKETHSEWRKLILGTDKAYANLRTKYHLDNVKVPAK